MTQKSFKQQLQSGFIYTAIAKYSAIVISLVVTAILSRLLSPDDFGVIAVASVFIVFFSIFSDLGLSAAIVQKRDLGKDELRSLYSYTIYLGIFLGIIFFCSSWIIADIYNDSKLISVCQILSVNVLFATWNIIPNGLLFRDKLFKYIGVRTIVVQLILACISIVSAYSGAGIYSLLINPVGSAILLFGFSYAKNPLGFSITPKFDAVRKVASYSGYTFGFSLINYFTRNLDKLMIGRVFGMAPLGFYEKSYRLMLLPVQNLTQVITPVLHPILADFQDDIKQQTVKYLKLIEILALVGFPIAAFLYFTAEPLVILIFGNQWQPSVPVFKILSLTVGLQITGSTIGAFLQASNNTKKLFYIGMANTFFNVCGLLIGIYAIGTIEGVAWMWVVTMYFGLWNNWYFAKIVGIKPLEAFKPYFPTLYPTTVIIILLYAISFLWGFSLVTTLIVNFAVSSLIILTFLKIFNVFNILEFIRNIYTHHNKTE